MDVGNDARTRGMTCGHGERRTDTGNDAGNDAQTQATTRGHGKRQEDMGDIERTRATTSPGELPLSNTLHHSLSPP